MESELSAQARAKGATMNNTHASEKLNIFYRQASTHNALLEINHNQRQRKQLERSRAWQALRLAISTLIHLEISGNKHART
jgi:hypothetical protein